MKLLLTLFILSVAANKEDFHCREIEGADQARALYRTIGRPSQQAIEHILDHNFIRNCPITTADARRYVRIYVPGIVSLQGKVTKTPPEHVPTSNNQPSRYDTKMPQRRDTMYRYLLR
jgi:hypothetical protein